MEEKLICKKCGRSRELGRKLCRDCNLERLKLIAKKRYSEGKRTKYNLSCQACGNIFEGWRKVQKFCSNCWKIRIELSQENISNNNYDHIGFVKIEGLRIFRSVHRKLVEEILKRKLQTNEIVHHLDCDSKNNELENLIVMDRRTHGKLHNYLDDQRVILEKSGNENLGNCWNSLIVPMTTAWLETTGAKVIKILEISQSAAESL